VQPGTITDPQLLCQYKSLLSGDETIKVNRYIKVSDQHSALITRAFIRCILSHYDVVEPQEWQFGRGFNGKPYLKDSPIALEFNLSHASNMIVCAVTKSYPLGIDVEYTKRKSDTYKLAPRYFSPTEVDALLQFEHLQQPWHFYDYWTLKESYIKACGDGLAIPLNHFSFDLSNRSEVKLSFSPLRDDNPEHWQSWLFEASEDHRMALTVKAPRRENITLTTRYLTPLKQAVLTAIPLALTTI